MVIKAVLFDLDDTLTRRTSPRDANAILAGQVAQLKPQFARLGYDRVDLYDFVRRFWANFEALYPDPWKLEDAPLEEPRWGAGPAVLADTLAEYGVGLADNAFGLWEALNRVPEHVFSRHLYPDAIATVHTLRAGGYRLAVVTSRPESGAIVAYKLDDQGLDGAFAAVVTSGDVGYNKPHPLIFEAALDRLGIASEEAVLVGDGYELDIVPAARLGMVPVLKLNEGAPDPARVLARHQVASLSALLHLEILRRG